MCLWSYTASTYAPPTKNITLLTTQGLHVRGNIYWIVEYSNFHLYVGNDPNQKDPLVDWDTSEQRQLFTQKGTWLSGDDYYYIILHYYVRLYHYKHT